ncbi:MAG: hypothetical protein RQ715_01975 [Methylococcales bacterium]|nr:hypothetical protein [Methylococcales bacterium]
MKAPVVIIGIGELASVFAHGLLRLGHPVYPITRHMDITQEAAAIPLPERVVIMVPEDQLDPVLTTLPEVWRDRVGLLQNELLPRDWQRHGLVNPTITVIWLEKKKDRPVTRILYNSSYGPGAQLMTDALTELNIPAKVLTDENELLYELVRKALYILTVNIAGLKNNCTVGELWRHHPDLAESLAREVLQIQTWLVGQPLPEQRLIAGMVEGIEDCPDRFCLGRRANARLERCLRHADQAGLAVPVMRELAQDSGKPVCE